MPTDTRTSRGDGARRRPRNRNRRPAAPAGTHNRVAPDTTVVAAPVAVTDDRSFAELGVPAAIVAALAADGVTSPFPIQAATLPDTLAGLDVLGRGQTGSGKTIAFSVPTVARLIASGTPRQPRRPRALVLVPTRELASQVAATVAPLATATGLRVAVVFGGVGQGPQVKALKNGVDLLIACPGRLEDLIGQGHCDLGAVEVTVLDEADHMADLGFLPAVRRLLDATPRGGQRLLFSATLDNGVDALVRRYLTNPVLHSTAPAVAPVSTMAHHVLAVETADKGQVVRELASGQGRTLLFARTKHGAKKLAKVLTAAGIPAVDLHGNLSQNARKRNLAAFSEGTTRVLVATDIAARGIHVDDIGLVVHVDPPAEHKAYLHRSGRTARAGAGGSVVTVMTHDQTGDVRTLTRQAGITPTITRVGPGHPAIAELTGPAAPLVAPAKPTPAATADEPARGPGGGQAGRGRPRRRRGGGSGQGDGSGRGRDGAAAESNVTTAKTGTSATTTPNRRGRGRGGRGRGGATSTSADSFSASLRRR
ncbi:Superfamily II DNA and RNA helicase [Jiangella alba]|uniref:Superfamily II DNA and RNA helicase n=1 Tax=Jiangella alba TaxID=561176 RepID=A0A1H5PFZ0_9ACTN|nr:DEAD/DEAH box helicase [Jiangella alba]SEF12616.1 Superfamily II DNA and RNA helicase [Jiangella alba]